MHPPPRGPGDDAALCGNLLLTTDALLEGEHFRATEPPFLLGRKALAVNLSDIAAMGGSPVACLLCLGLPASCPSRFVEGFLEGFASAAAEYGVEWSGGDLVRSPAGIHVSVTAVGLSGRRLLTRSGAKPGDGVYVTGPLGSSAAGRALLSSGWKVNLPPRAGAKAWRAQHGAVAAARLAPHLRPPRRRARSRAGRRTSARERLAAAELIARHLDPAPRLDAGRFLASRGLASAAIDLSDGLSLDLHRLCEASGVGAVILRDALPMAQPLRDWAARTRRDPVLLALHGGEEYEILFTAPPRAAGALARWPLGDGTGPILIGRIRSRREGIRLADPRGRMSRLPSRGYDPFARRGGSGAP